MQSNKIVEKIINTLLNILIFIFGIILLIFIYIGVQTKVLDKNYADFFGYSIFDVQTGSMENTISAGDWIIVKITKNVSLNDIVTYRSEGEYITHRIIEVYNGTYITKGDANNSKDDPIDQNQIVGKVVKIVPFFGLLRKTIFNPAVLIALIVTLALFNLAFKKNQKNHKNNILDIIINKIRSYFNNSKNTPVFEEQKPKVIIKDLKSYDNSYEIGRIKNEESKEEELSKTAIYRVISVDSNEVDSKYKEEIDENKLEKSINNEKEIQIEEDLEKTAMYRIVSVDSSEIDNTLLEVAENEIKKANKNTKINEVKEEELPVEEEKKEINLDLIKLKRGNKKAKNIIDAAMIIKEEEIEELIDVFIQENKNNISKNIRETFKNSYIKSKYYSNDGDIEYCSKNSISKIRFIIDSTANELIKQKNKNEDLIEKYANTFSLIANIEQAKDSIIDLKAKNGFYKKEIMKYSSDWDSQSVQVIIDKIEDIQRKYDASLNAFLEKLDTNLFELKFNQLATKKNMYALDLIHNISFSKIYSDYIIDKTYSEGIVAEDKTSVSITLLLRQLIKDMISSKFNLKYLLYVPGSLYSKEKKFEKFLKMIEDEYAKSNVFIVITIEDLIKNKIMAKKIRKMGYKFALVFNKEIEITEKDRGYIYIADYVFVDKKAINMAKVLPYIPEELLNNLIYENIEEKVGGLEGE